MGVTQSTWGVSQATEKKKDQAAREREAKAMCVRYTLLIANSLLALLGLLLLAGGVWRIVDDESLRDVAKEIQDTQEWNDVKGEVTGLEGAVKEASTHKYFNYALLAMGGIPLLVALFGYCGAKKREPVPPLPLQHLRLHHPPPPDRRHRLHQR